MKNLTKKLVNILKKVDNLVEKSGYNNHQNYAYVMEKDLLESVRKELIDEGIFIFSSVEDTSYDNKLTSVRVKNTFVDSESGETFEVFSAGQGADNQDKGVYKAITGAYKYFVMKNFMLSGDDDPEKSEQQSNYSKPKPKNKPTTSNSGGFKKSGGSFGKSTSNNNSKSFSEATSKFTKPKITKVEVEETAKTAEDIPFM